MNNYGLVFLIFTLFLGACNKKTEKSEEKILITEEETYLGQKPPGLVPEVFQLGSISLEGRYEYGISFSKNLDEVYFSGSKENENASIFHSKLNAGKWSNPLKLNFTKGERMNEMEPFISLDGQKIYFTAYDLAFSNENTWVVNREGDSWAAAKVLESPINEDLNFYFNQSENGDIFYTNLSKNKIYYSPNVDGQYTEIRDLGLEFGFHSFISKSQDFILIDGPNKENDNRQDFDIYVCFKKEDGSWTKPINLGSEVNTEFGETCPSITPDGKYLFFSRYNEEGGLSNFYWVSTEVITRLLETPQKKSTDKSSILNYSPNNSSYS